MMARAKLTALGVGILGLLAAGSLALTLAAGMGQPERVAASQPSAANTMAVNPVVPIAPHERVSDAASLVREVRAAEAWVDKAKSLRMKVQSTWTKSPEHLAQLKAEHRGQFPDVEPTTQRFPDLRPESSSSCEIAFDAKRGYYRSDGVLGDGTFYVGIWDGRQGIGHEKDGGNQAALYGLYSKPGTFLRALASELSWLRAAPHSFWFLDEKYRLDERFLGRPEDYQLTGRTTFHGIACYVLDTHIFGHRLYVGVDDHRLHGQLQRVIPKSAIGRADKVWMELARREGQVLAGKKAIGPWLEGLAADTRQRLDREYFRELLPVMVPQTEHWLLDYKEVAPGRFVPMTMGYSMWDTEASVPKPFSTRSMKVVQIAVDEPLPDDLFQMEFVDGAEVNDWGHNPPLFYKYKKDRTPEEWNAIFDEANRRQSESNASKRAREKLIGQEAPDFPATQ